MTKCGRYGLSSFDYSPSTIRASVKRSLERLKTDYLDTVYLHDVEFVCTPVAPQPTGNHTSALKDEATAYGLAEGDEAKVRGEGDQKFLDAFHTLQELKDEGLIKNIGITGEQVFFPGLPSYSSIYFRFSFGYIIAPRHLDPPHPSLQTIGRSPFLFALMPSKCYIPRLHTSFLRTRQGRATRRSFSVKHGPSHR